MKTALDFHLFKKEDFPEYLIWFQDSDLNKRLGPMEEDDEWLSYILDDQEGCTYSVFLDQKLVSVIGIVYPDKEYPSYGISNIAVNPRLRSKGIGKKVLKEIRDLHPLKKGQYWKAYVDETNPKAKAFFEKNGWECVGKSPKNNTMFTFEYRTKASKAG